MTFIEGDAVLYLKRENGRQIEELRKQEAEYDELRAWIVHFLIEELEVSYDAFDHVIGCKRCFVDWEARGIRLCDDYDSEE